jgi:hypothetical protein
VPRVSIPKRETELRDAFWKRFEHLFPHYLVLNHQDVRSSGHPDSTLSGYIKTSWWEFKHATPTFTTYKLQELTCARLDNRSFCRYIIFKETHDSSMILVVRPSQILGKKGRLDDVAAESCVNGFDFDWLASIVHRAHKPI